MRAATDHINQHLPPAAVPGVAEISLHTAVASSRLSAFQSNLGTGAPPYWAYPWAGGIALARYILDQPETVRDLAVIDIGSGSGLVAIAAMKAGASRAIACERDAGGRAAIALNAQLNDVELDVVANVPDAAEAKLMLAGDVFYSIEAGQEMARLFDAAVQRIPILIGDPFRAALPRDRLELIGDYDVADVGSGAAKVRAGVFRWLDLSQPVC